MRQEVKWDGRPKDAGDMNTRTTRVVLPFSDIISNTGCFLDVYMSKVRAVMANVGIEAAVRPICGKGKARADNRKLFPFYFFIDHGRDGERVLPYVMHESRISHSGTVVGHHFISPEVNLQKR
jgi:hypothetical protein